MVKIATNAGNKTKFGTEANERYQQLIDFITNELNKV